MSKLDVTKASEATLREYAESAEAYRHAPSSSYDDNTALRDRWNHASDKLRAECTVTLRTRAEVDADIATVVRSHHEAHEYGISCVLPEREERLKRLCAEPMAEPEMWGVSNVEFATAEPEPAPDPDPCGCEETEELRRKNEQLRRNIEIERRASRELMARIRKAEDALR